MASGHVEPGLPILKTLSSPQIRGGFTLPLPLPPPRLGRPEVPLEVLIPPKNMLLAAATATFSNLGPHGAPKCF